MGAVTVPQPRPLLRLLHSIFPAVAFFLFWPLIAFPLLKNWQDINYVYRLFGVGWGWGLRLEGFGRVRRFSRAIDDAQCGSWVSRVADPLNANSSPKIY